MNSLAPLPHQLTATARAHPELVAQRELVDGTWHEWTYAQLLERVTDLAAWLVEGGFAVGDRVALVAPNCPAWTVVDYAATSAGGTLVPVHLSSGAEQKNYVLKHSDASVVATLGDEELGKVSDMVRGTSVRVVVAVECSPEARDEAAGAHLGGIPVVDLEEAIAAGGRAPQAAHDELARRLENADLDALATILYTSGTTGTPKAVPLTHRNFTTQFQPIIDGFAYQPGLRSLSFLPLSHAFERAWTALGVQQGFSISYCRNPREVADLLVAAQPQVMVSVPRLYERVYSGAQAKVAGSPVKQALMRWSLAIGRRRNMLRFTGKPVDPVTEAAYKVADLLVLHNIRDALGGDKVCMASGGAALRREIEEFLLAAGVLVSPGYGLSETSPVISFRGAEEWRFGTVGKVIQGMEIRLVPVEDNDLKDGEGEIQVRGEGVFAGYLPDLEGNDPAPGAFTEDGWFRTGDIGQLDDEGFLSITGRTKDIIVTDGGRNISPAGIENVIDSDDLIEYSMVVGDNRPYLTAVVSLDQAVQAELLPGASAEEIQAEATRRVTALTAGMARYERITKVLVAPEPFTMEGGELTPTLKVKRRVVAEKWAEEIDALYG
ncbi:long-chain acyl-CoA synthetase [Kytococcus aerolatus]|uniref:Long-chain acyl-CoA synthetase n=1 Tax=Kytococcus aerolatus TaxID=592308 RepID=A0A212T4W8_9MICO|nr:long-chain fatty acid--CoA ligase [Kytococcus aerolatus]SNC61055.1 long-chain acyl-CoA synthetase [Kytococcus aerolatus]